MEVQLRHHPPLVGLTILESKDKDSSGDVGGILLKYRGGLVVIDAVLPNCIENLLSLRGTLAPRGRQRS